MSERMLYLECASGIAGDMLVAALLDLGADETAMRTALASLPVDGFEARVSRVVKSGLDACDFDVVLEHGLENHDHDMDWLHGRDGHEHGHEHEHHHHHHHDEHEHHHHHDDEHEHDHHHHHHDHEHEHHHHHEHRGLADIRAILDAATLTPGARKLAERAFEILAAAEAKAHGTTPDKVHFHEVGAVDSIVDIVAASVLFDSLGISAVAIPSLTDGHGTIRCAHGIVPVPVPATLNICAAEGIDLVGSSVAGELVTPTGAALAAALRTTAELPERYKVLGVGLGAGKRDYECPGVLRAMLIEPTSPSREELVWRLECDIDDSSGEALGHVMGRLLETGAREVHYLPMFTKKNRPGWQLQVICTEDKIARFEQIIFADTTTIGIRRQAMQRTILPREQLRVPCELGEVEAKRVTLPDGSSRTYPEYESVAALAKEAGMSFQQAWAIALSACTREG